ncbi:MAG: 3-hydroxyacyl-ACP dehydratase FabZ [Parachlamydiaceae bacterium]|nr:3-hydroxyacyl-ACP dehydratase FabZ [Parachlamydiaceae bacterium]
MTHPQSEESQTLDIKDILKILPHRFPLLLVDKILEVDIEKGYILGQKNLTFNENFFQGHFPDAPIMPGVLILEALAQAGSVLFHLKEKTPKTAVLLSITNAKFRNPVRPGDILLLKCEGLHFSSKGGRIHGTALVNGKVAADADIGFALVSKSQI